MDMVKNAVGGAAKEKLLEEIGNLETKLMDVTPMMAKLFSCYYCCGFDCAVGVMMNCCSCFMPGDAAESVEKIQELKAKLKDM